MAVSNSVGSLCSNWAALCSFSIEDGLCPIATWCSREKCYQWELPLLWEEEEAVMGEGFLRGGENRECGWGQRWARVEEAKNGALPGLGHSSQINGSGLESSPGHSLLWEPDTCRGKRAYMLKLATISAQCQELSRAKKVYLRFRIVTCWSRQVNRTFWGGKKKTKKIKLGATLRS